MIWLDVCEIAAIPLRGARVLRPGGVDIAVFRTGEGRIYALRDRCPHRGGPLSQGIVHGDRVTCPLHDWIIDLRSGAAASPDEGCTETYPVRIDGGRVQVCMAALAPESAPALEPESAPALAPESALALAPGPTPVLAPESARALESDRERERERQRERPSPT